MLDLRTSSSKFLSVNVNGFSITFFRLLRPDFVGARNDIVLMIIVFNKLEAFDFLFLSRPPGFREDYVLFFFYAFFYFRPGKKSEHSMNFFFEHIALNEAEFVRKFIED